MTAGFFIANTSPPGVTAGLPGAAHAGIAGAGASGAAPGFEALLAAFFGNQAAGTSTAQAALLSGKPGQTKTASSAAGAGQGANDNVEDAAKPSDGKASDQGQTISAEVQALAALMATPVTPSNVQPAATDAGKSGPATSATAGAAFAGPNLLSPAAAKAQAAADQAASQAADALAAGADASTLAKDVAPAADKAVASAKPIAPDLITKVPISGDAGLQAAPAQPAEAAPLPYAPPVAGKVEARASEPPSPPVQDATDLGQTLGAAASATGLASAEAAATAPAALAPVKPKDLPPSHAGDRKDADHLVSADAALADGPAAANLPQHPVAAVTPVGAKTAGPADAGAKAPAEEAKLAKAEEPGLAGQPTAPAAADHALQAGSTATAAARATPETVNSLAAQIVRKAEGRSTRFDVELHPADLGRVDVRLEIGAQGRMTAAMSFENPQAAAEMRGRAHELQAALERAGFDVSGGLSFDVAGDQGQGGQNLAGQQQQPDGGGASRGRAFQAALQSAGDASAAAISSAFSGQARTTSGVDIRI